MSKPALVIFDLDQTLTEKDTYLPYLFSVLIAKPWRIWRWIFLPFFLSLYILKIKDNTWLKVKFLNAVLKGLSLDDLKPISQKFTKNLLVRGLNQKMIEVLQIHIDKGDRLILLSASLDCYVSHIGSALGFGEIIATPVKIVDNRIAGGLSGPNLKGTEKVNIIQNYLAEERQSYLITAYADDISDQYLLEWVDRGFWIEETPKLRSLKKEGIGFL